jgi:hypothetical protein
VTREGKRLIRKIEVRKESTHCFGGNPDCARSVNPASTMCLCFLLAIPFC